MRKRVYIVSTGFALCLSALTVICAKPGVNSGSSFGAPRAGSPSDAVSKFWRFSLRGDAEGVNKTVTKTPKDYYDMANKCLAAKGAKPYDGGTVPLPVAVDPGSVSSNEDVVFEISSLIRERGYRYHKVEAQKETGNHALLLVKYGPDERMAYGNLFLLSKEAGEWKIFKITNAWGLSLENEYFAQSDCSEPGRY